MTMRRAEGGVMGKWVITAILCAAGFVVGWLIAEREACDKVVATCPVGHACKWGENCVVVILPEQVHP